MQKVFWGLLGLYISFLMIRYREKIVNFTGKIGWAETYLGRGGTYNAMILIAIIFFFWSILYMTGNLDFIFGGLGKFFGARASQS